MKFNTQLTILGFVAGALVFTYQTKGENNGLIDMQGLALSGGVGTVASLVLQQLAGGKKPRASRYGGSKPGSGGARMAKRPSTGGARMSQKPYAGGNGGVRSKNPHTYKGAAKNPYKK